MRTGSLLLALLLTGCGPADTKFEAHIAKEGPHRVAASGEAALPDGAQLNVSLERDGVGEPLATVLPRIKDGRWTALLDTQRDVKEGAYLVRVVFSPKAYAWSEAVRPAVGENGEKLGGASVKQGDGYRYLELTRPVWLP